MPINILTSNLCAHDLHHIRCGNNALRISDVIEGVLHVGTILDLGRPGADIPWARGKNVSTMFPPGFHTVGVVFSTEMCST